MISILQIFSVINAILAILIIIFGISNITTLNNLYMKITDLGSSSSENIHTSNYNSGNDLSTYIDYSSNGSKVFKIFSNKISYSSGDTNIRVKNKRKISSTEYLAEILYET